MKKALIAILILVSILLALPFAEGIWVEKKYLALHQLVSKRTPLNVEVINYQRGWFSSSATIKVLAEKMGNTQPSLENSHFIVKEKLYHGPIIFPNKAASESLSKGLTFAVAVGEIHVKQPDLQLNSLATYHYNGNVDIKFECPTFTFPMVKAGEFFGIQGLRGSFRFTKHFKHSQGEIHLEAANLPIRDNQQTIKNATYTYSLDNSGYDLWHGKRFLTVDNLVLTSTDKWQFQNLTLSLSDHTNAHELDSQLEAKINELKVNDIQFGKQQFIFNLAHLNLQTLTELGEKADLLDKQSSPIAVRALELTPLALQLVSNGLTLNLSGVELNTKWGLLSGNASVEMPKQDKPLTQITALMSSLVGKADLNIPAKLLEDMLELRYQALTTPDQQKQSASTPQSLAKENIDRWVLAGWLIPSGDHYQMNILYKTNQLLLNGKPMKLPSLPIPSVDPNALNR